MKKLFKILKYLFFIVLALTLLTTSFFTYLYYSSAPKKQAISIVPEDAIFMIETNNVTDAWQKISYNPIWKDLKKNDLFSDINESLKTVDLFLKDNIAVEKLLKDRKLLISSHLISGTDYDFIFVIDLQKASKISFLNELLEVLEYKVKRSNFRGKEIIEFLDEQSQSPVFLTLIDNLLVGSFSSILIEDAINTAQISKWEINPHFLKVANDLSDRKLFNFYFNFSQLDKFFKIYSKQESEIIKSLAKNLNYSAFNVNLEKQAIQFTGYSNIDTIPSYLRALSRVKSGKSNVYRVLSKDISIYSSYCFDNFHEFFTQINKEFSKDESFKLSTDIGNLEKLFKIDLQNNFLKWIGNEIALAKEIKKNKEIIYAVVHAKDVELAKQFLDNLLLNVNKKSATSFEKYEYKNFTIDFFNLKDIFKLFLGDMFKDIEKPYFTIIEDFLVFSNEKADIEKLIDDYLQNKTWAYNSKFLDFKDNLNVKSNYNIFIQSSKLYDNLYKNSPKIKQYNIEKNKELISSFSQIACQFIADEGIFKTNIQIQHDKNLLFNEKFNNLTSVELFKDEYETLNFKIKLHDSLLLKNEKVKYFDDDSLRHEGLIKNNLANGLWKCFYKSGRLKNLVSYKEDKINGKTLFYYDNDGNSLKAEVLFSNDEIKGIYKEFYENKARKTILNYQYGKVNGKAQFFYKNGMLKIEGQYQDGFKTGVWNYYKETGEFHSKYKFKKGIQS